MVCEVCGDILVIGSWPFCKGSGSHTPGVNNVIEDSIPGGYVVRHGICNEDGSPRKYYSKKEMEKEAKRRGLRNHVEHVPPQGTDKSSHTSRWV